MKVIKENNIYIKKELILNLFNKFVQQKGKYTKSKTLLINIGDKISYMSLLSTGFMSVLEYIIYKLNLPLIMITNKLDQSKYYFLVMSSIKYIKKFIFNPFLKSIRSKKKLPFIFNFIVEFNNILKENSSLVDHKENVLNIFEDTNAYIRTKKINSLTNSTMCSNFMYVNYKLKYVRRNLYNANIYTHTYVNTTTKEINKNKMYNKLNNKDKTYIFYSYIK
ncbi:permease, putative (apicoplast) [Babesia ovis]|uniref:Permease, putative n=1 Tax=Babesia ovis TaxID=5869 RepID=A0A9W5TE08_BABOV|nr:permease, putative [Babesia ovis]